MGLSKYPFGRYQIIDRELRRKKWVKSKELVEIIAEELSIKVSTKTINNDINDMIYDSTLNYNAPIEIDRKNKGYKYTDENYTITNFGLKEDDINALKFYINTLNQYKEYEVFKDFSNAIEKVLDAVNIRSGIKNFEHAKIIVQTEFSPKLTGSELIPLIVQALDEKRVIEFTYKKFDGSEPKNVLIEPHLLKEDRHRWYILGRLERFQYPTTTYALDRMENLIITDSKFDFIEFNYDNYFNYSFGITVPDEDPIEVILSFPPEQGKYLKTLLIHKSQKILVDTNKEFRISIYIKPSYEFFERILGFGKNVRILSPQSVINEVKSTINFLKNLYN